LTLCIALFSRDVLWLRVDLVLSLAEPVKAALAVNLAVLAWPVNAALPVNVAVLTIFAVPVSSTLVARFASPPNEATLTTVALWGGRARPSHLDRAPGFGLSVDVGGPVNIRFAADAAFFT
jgi:hypothetical protein